MKRNGNNYTPLQIVIFGFANSDVLTASGETTLPSQELWKNDIYSE